MIRRIKNVSVLVFLLAVLTGSSNQADHCGDFGYFCEVTPFGPGLGFDCISAVSCAYVTSCMSESGCTVEYCNASGGSWGGPWGAAYCG